MAIPGLGWIIGGVGLAALAFAALDDEDKGKGEKPWGWTDKALNGVSEVRPFRGSSVRFFRGSIVDVIMNQLLANGHLAPVAGNTVPGMSASRFFGAAVYEVRPGWGPDWGVPNARDAAVKAQQQGLAVLGTYDVAVPKQGGRYLVFAPAAMVPQLADPDGGLAVILPPLGKKKPSNGPPIPPPGVEDDERWDSHMPAELRHALDELMDDPNVDPHALEQAADGLEKKYPKAARTLRAEADLRRERLRLRHVKQGYSPWTVREGDLPAKLAQYYTGDPLRWYEIADVPGSPTKVAKKNGNDVLSPWYPGLQVRLPVSWEIWTKPAPPTVKGGPPVDWQKAYDDIVDVLTNLGDKLQKPGELPKTTPPWQRQAAKVKV